MNEMQATYFPSVSEKLYNYHTYALILFVPKPLRLRLGKFGTVPLESGWYLYTGSARKNIAHRLSRHFRRDKTKRWHIDGLTTARGIGIVGAVVLGEGWSECLLQQWLARNHQLSAPIAKFGSSDCKTKCPAHLLFGTEAISPESLVGDLGAGLPVYPGWRGRLLFEVNTTVQTEIGGT